MVYIFLPPRKDLHCLGSLILNFKIVLKMKNLTEEYMTDLLASLCSFFLERENAPLRFVQTLIINISKYINNFLSTIPTTLILSSLVSEF